MENFFDELLERLQADPAQISRLMFAAEEQFKRTGFRDEIPVGVENILIIRLDAIGDMVLTSGFIREVRANFPRARITLVVAPLVKPIVELCPYVNEVLTFDRNASNRNLVVLFEQLVTFCRENLWRKNFSVAFSPQWGSYSLPALMMAWLSGARERVGYGVNPYESWLGKPSELQSSTDNFWLTKNIVTPRSVVAEVDKHFYLLTAVGLAVNQTHMELFFDAADFLRARRLLKDLPPECSKVVVGIGAGLESRRYPVQMLAVALNALARKNLAFIIVGGRGELEDADYLERNLPRGKVLNLVGKTTLRETEAVISQADYYVGNDSGVMHMAAAAQVPCLVLYREAADKENYLPGVFSEYQRFPPWQTKAVILRPDHPLPECEQRGEIYGWCHHNEAHCITQISPQEIVVGFETLEELV